MSGPAAGPRFLILHGWQNHRPAGHWHRWLAERLDDAGHQVCYPQLPDPDFPVLKDWLASIESALARPPGTEQVVITHSLSCAAWLHLAAQGSVQLPVTRMLLVAPPSPQYLAETAALRQFRLPAEMIETVHAASRTVPRLVCADNDPYCRPAADAIYGGALDVDRIDGAGHFDLDSGYGPWPSVFRWCLDPTRRLNSR